MKNVVIIGCGLAGIGAAWKLKQEKDEKAPLNCTLFEKETRAGGLCRTERQGDFLFDYTGHLLHFSTDFFKDHVLALIGSILEQRNRSAWIFSKNVYTRYPFQANLFGLPTDVVAECLYEYSKQYFKDNKADINTFEDWIRVYFGDGIARHFMIPYNGKIYRVHPRELTPDAGGRFVPSSDLMLLLNGALSDMGGQLGYNSHFFYPSNGGIEAMVSAMTAGLDNINLSEGVERIIPSEQILITTRGRKVQYDFIISTQPLPLLVNGIEDDIGDIRDAASRLRAVSVLNINLGIKGDLGDRHWIYVPEEEYLFHRLGFTNNFSDSMAPSGHSSIYLEISYDPKKGIDVEWARGKCVDDLIKMGIIGSADQVVCEKILDIPYGYVIFDDQRQNSIDKINNYLESKNIYSAGRFGSWEYSSMEDAFLLGVKAAESISAKHAKVSGRGQKITLDSSTA
ncbi:MAG: FAD-dependent oxidoreductase [Chitinispirillales bacterium]|jgi:protoporphyrinogen oxidase|nr:FAD-dependent oxidoreductase [Chitinispirillales bacterium]